jgi:hypothetical protein
MYPEFNSVCYSTKRYANIFISIQIGAFKSPYTYGTNTKICGGYIILRGATKIALYAKGCLLIPSLAILCLLDEEKT